jgi:hypothetical protein
MNLARRMSTLVTSFLLLVGGTLLGASEQSASASGPNVSLEVHVETANAQPAAGAEVFIYLSELLLAKGVTNAEGLATVSFPSVDVKAGLSVHAYGSGHQVRWSAIDPNLLEGSSTAPFEMSLPRNAHFVNVTGAWRSVKDHNPADYWHFVLKGSDAVDLTVTWSSGAAGHTGLHGVAHAQRDVTTGNQESFLSGYMHIKEGGAEYFGTFGVKVVDDNEILISYREIDLNNTPYAGQVVTNSEFVRVP